MKRRFGIVYATRSQRVCYLPSWSHIELSATDEQHAIGGLLSVLDQAALFADFDPKIVCISSVVEWKPRQVESKPTQFPGIEVVTNGKQTIN